MLACSYADGTLRHFHATTGRIIHEIHGQEAVPANSLYMVEFNRDGSKLATCGLDKTVRLYDEHTKALIIKLKETRTQCGHSNRVFCVKFNPADPHMLASGGWDNTV